MSSREYEEAATVYGRVKQFYEDWEWLPGQYLCKYLLAPAIYGMDTMSSEVHCQYDRLKNRETSLSAAEVDFLERFDDYNW